MTQTQTARALAEAYGWDPDEWLVPLPAGNRLQAWEHFMPLAALVNAWLNAHSRAT